MPALSDERFNSLRAQGFTGATNDMLLQWLQANGATSPALADAWREMLEVLGVSLQRSYGWWEYLDSVAPPDIGRNMNDLQLWFWSADGGGGIIGQPPVLAPAQSMYMLNGGSSHEIMDMLYGTGVGTYGVDAGIPFADWEGVFREAAANTIPLQGGRKVTNLLTEHYTDAINSSDDFSNAGVSNATVTYNGSYSTFTKIASGGSFVRFRGPSSSTEPPLSLKGLTLTQSATVRGVGTAIGKTFRLVSEASGDVGVGATITLTAQWQRVTHVRPPKLSASTEVMYFNLDAGGTPLDAGDVLEVKEVGYEFTDGNSNTAPSEHIPVTAASRAVTQYFSNENGNTVTNNIVTEGVGAPLAVAPALLATPAATNEITYSRDLTDASWAETGTSVAAYNAIGLTGEANTATTLTDDDGAGYEDVRRSLTLSVTTAYHTLRYFIAKDSDTSRFPLLGMDMPSPSGQAYYHLNTATGATVVESAHTTAAIQVNDAGAFWEVLIEMEQDGGTVLNLYAFPARATTIGTKTTAATGSIIVGNVELHNNKTIDDVRGTPPIFTSGSTVTRSAITTSYDIANHADARGAYYCEMTSALSWDDAAIGDAGVIGLHSGTSYGPLTITNSSGTSGRFAAYDSDYDRSDVPINWQKDTTYAIGMSYGNGLHVINIDGTEDASPATYSGQYPLGGVYTGIEIGVGSAGGKGVILITNIRRYDLAYTDAKAKIAELML